MQVLLKLSAYQNVYNLYSSDVWKDQANYGFIWLTNRSNGRMVCDSLWLCGSLV